MSREHVLDKKFNVNIPSVKNCCSMGGCNKLEVHDWLDGVPGTSQNEIVEVRFKSTRKGFFYNVNELKLSVGDIIAVEASPGHDIGIVSMMGELVYFQMKKNGVKWKDAELKKIYRKAKDSDIKKWQDAMLREKELLVVSREVATSLRLNMKIGDVEFQGDMTKAIFYYIADERVDFREMIKVLADRLRIRIEMRQIGARQEAGRIGGIGPCGRELCCTGFMTNFVSVSTNAARCQDVSLNPQKLAGQCSKLKCCLNYELPVYIDAQKDFPDTHRPLETIDGLAYHKKTDILSRTMWYSFDPHSMANMIMMSVDRVKEVIELNKKAIKVEQLVEQQTGVKPEPVIGYEDSAGKDSLTRFDRSKNKNKKRRYKK